MHQIMDIDPVKCVNPLKMPFEAPQYVMKAMKIRKTIPKTKIKNQLLGGSLNILILKRLKTDKSVFNLMLNLIQKIESNA